MSKNVHGHTLPTAPNVNPDNPIFQRHQPEYEAPEVPAGLHGAPALRSENESPVEDKKPSAADLDAVAEEEAVAKKTKGKKPAEDPPLEY
jgi:hypothetical protein